MTENFNYKVGDKVLYRKHIDQYRIWTVTRVDHKAKRCYIKRVTPDRIFERSAAFKFLILEVDLPRAAALMTHDHAKPKREPKPAEDSVNNMVAIFERIAAILKLVETQGELNTKQIKDMVMPDLSIRTVQRHTDTLAQNGYLECIKGSVRNPNLYRVTKKARAMMNWPGPDLVVNEAF